MALRPYLLQHTDKLTMLWLKAVAIFLLLLTGQADGECDNIKASNCLIASTNSMVQNECKSTKIIPGLESCITPVINTCSAALQAYWKGRITTYETELQNIIKKSSPCTTKCLILTQETQALAKCSTGYTDIINKIKTDGPQGKNVTVACRNAQTAVSCLNQAFYCPSVVKSRNEMLAKYTSVEQYCKTSKTSPTQNVDNNSSSSTNMTVVILVVCLVVIIVILDILLCIFFLYKRRQRAERKRREGARWPTVSLPMRYS